ncbi:hypothetical protein EB796_020927 [Bugula neritina]|uniref:Uncharacterized protein n=1 Tax=Bugula neritina TaxID=10212 RepID=A0A7J7J524_BUGNE|nr:hypothetical protein EB796_020927 [Bugula neritina]
MQAVKKHATLPAIMALTTMAAISFFLDGAIAPRPPSIMPILPRLAKPHKAYTAIVSPRACQHDSIDIL